MRSVRLVVLVSLLLISRQGLAAAPAQTKPKPATPASKKYFVQMYQLPDLCVSSRPTSYPQAVTITQILPTGATCPANYFLVPSPVPAADIAKALASDQQYSLEPINSNTIAIYVTDAAPPTKPDPRLRTIIAAINDLAKSAVAYAEVIHLSGATAKQAADLVNDLKSDGITAQPLDGDKGSSILLESRLMPSLALLAEIKQRLFDLRWQRPATPPTQQLFHLDAANVVKALSGSADSGEDKGAKSDKGESDKKSSDKSSDKSSKGTSGQTATSTASPTVSVSVTSAATDTTKLVVPDSAKDDKEEDKDKPSDSGKKSPAADSPAKPPSMKAVNDTIVYSNDDGTDRGIFERNRLMAVLDLPRPEVLLNLWSLQASSRDYHVTNTEADAIHTAVTEHNQILQNAIDDGWQSLSKQMSYNSNSFFDRKFYDYITQKFSRSWPPPPPGFTGDQVPSSTQKSKDVADKRKEELEKYSDSVKHAAAELAARRASWGWCGPDHYCLGFTHAFEPLRPTFTNILLAIVAADNPTQVAHDTIGAMEGDCPPKDTEQPEPCNNGIAPSPREVIEKDIDGFFGCMKTQSKAIQTDQAENAATDCELKDRLNLTEQIVQSRTEQSRTEHLQLNCFRKQADKSFQGGSSETSTSQTTRVGLLRAAIADFLFNYKWATQYPHDFIPYDLSQSAAELNAELNPLILAFNRDVSAFTQTLQSEMQCKYLSVHHGSLFRKSDETFLNDGMIAVRGISGVESIVDTVTQSFFDATKPPSLTDLLTSVSNAEKNIPGVLQTNLTANEAAVLLGALNSVTPAEAKIGRELKLDIIPHSLAGASSAELEVKLTAEESGNPTYFTANKSSEDNLSRVATHDTTTKVRVESLKLFEVSAFEAMLQRPRSKFPVLPPFFEIPYFGSFISVPIPGAKVYHRSAAIISAVIVPTAADLAYGIDFTADRVCEPSTESDAESISAAGGPRLTCHRANSPGDFGGLPLRNFHKAIVQCFASKDQTAYTGRQSSAERLPSECPDLKFSDVPPNE